MYSRYNTVMNERMHIGREQSYVNRIALIKTADLGACEVRKYASRRGEKPRGGECDEKRNLRKIDKVG